MSLPWLYRYASESRLWRDREVLRPVVPVTIVGPEGETAPRVGLVDTGAENVLAAEWLADFAGVDLSHSVDTALIAIGGHSSEVRFTEVELRLYAPEMGDEFMSWRFDIGFVPDWQAPFAMVLGQRGFLDQFTVTFHRGAAALAIEEWAAFDARFATGSP